MTARPAAGRRRWRLLSSCRQIGASVGIAVFGSLFVARLTDAFASLPPSAGDGPGFDPQAVRSLTPQLLATLPAAARETIADAFATALPPLFVYGVPVMLTGLVLARFVTERPLRTAIED